MKSLLIITLAFICIFAHRTLAHENIENMDLEEILDTFQDPDNIIMNNNYNNNSNSNEKVENSNININQETNTMNDIQTELLVSQPFPEYNDNSGNTGAKIYVLSGVGFTSVALIAFLGYKNFRKNAELDEMKKELLFESMEENRNDISMPDRVKQTKSINRLSKSLSLNLSDIFNEEKPVVSSSIYSDNYSLVKNRAYKCHFNWSPFNSDEIILKCGDLICVKESYDDGYSLGRNLYTRFYGIFPTCCLSTPEEKMMGSELIKEGEFESILKRTSSKNMTKRSRRASSSVSVVIPTWM
ncbi:hypothetical protein BCR36DRAFT_316949 [Piromyces finnis]|uniref:SH3 domain-containing protein n=1 Tax=Piromyces finnis TaxID=1754191 RepID=A0A1Y1VLW0_9FUNG|nr:hypothetical protein BCR36DRAFT_316949 [Piromyces finnis]|eukprot:ORX59106.1 hypothetical protein BCR36DRAFT_316949 [Piromyces finnis]